jgi:hypothetical protein
MYKELVEIFQYKENPKKLIFLKIITKSKEDVAYTKEKIFTNCFNLVRIFV